MLEILVGIAAIVAMAKIASSDNQSPLLWGCITFVLLAASMLIPLPVLRVGIAALVAFLALFVYKIVADK